jgi:stage II sporulation protein D
LVAVVLLLAACSSSPQRPVASSPAPVEPRESAPPPAAVEPAPSPVAKPAPPPPEPAAPAPSSLPPLPETVRVGLATDQEEVVFPSGGEELEVLSGATRVAVASALRVRPAAGAARPGAYRLQVAALKDEGQAQGLAEQLERRTGEPSAVVFDAGTDLYRVRVGRYPTRAAAEAGQRLLGQHNVHDSWVVSEEGGLEDPAFSIVRGSESRRVEGRWLEVRQAPAANAEGVGVRVLDRRFRGTILLYLNDRGSINVINRVGFEDYLRGVVPREMGPKIYDDLDALKAQTVAARTYALKNMGEFLVEGYDICATPRCQAYGGMDWEQDLTDQAIAETASEVLVYRGELADSLYSSTCGGHTEDVEVVFPLKAEPYLRGVPCLEGGVEVLASETSSRLSLPSRLAHEIVPPNSGTQAEVLGERLQSLARLAGLTTPADQLESVDRREVQRYIGSQFDLALDARLFMADEDVEYLLDNPPAQWTAEDLHLAAYLKRSGFLGGALEEPLDPEEIDETLFQLALFLRLIERREVRFMGLDQAGLHVREDGEETLVPLPARVATYRRRGETTVWSNLKLVPGDRMTLFMRGDDLLAALQDVDLDGLGYDRTSNFSNWTRFHTDSKLAELVRSRYPDLELARFELLSRGVSGRVGEMRLHGKDGQTEVVRGLPIRWTLEIPDTLFTARRLTPAEGESGWLFTGRGWGHGVGMCQVGAYGMGLRGHSYSEILHHYYTGVELVRLKSRPSAVAGR